MGVLFTFPSRYYFAIGHPGVFSLARRSLLIHTGFHVPHATRVRALLPFRSPLLRESLLLSFPLATKMFQFARLSLACPWIQQQFKRLTYSGISGSMLIFNSPKHFVACHALPRLRVPRYPPSNCQIGRISCYHIPLYRLGSRAGDKRTRTADIRHGVNHRILAVLENPATREPGTESSPFFPPDSLVLRMSDCPSPTLPAQPERTANAFHFSNQDALRPIIPDNACILCLTAAAGTELADAYSSDTVIASSPGKEVHDPWAFHLHAALLRQAFAHCGKFPTAASRRSLGRVSVPVWLIILSDQLLIIALPFPAVVPLPRAGSYALPLDAVGVKDRQQGRSSALYIII
eukprot:Gb_32444 [translate_table: standard]